MLVALGHATVDGSTRFGHTRTALHDAVTGLRLTPGRCYAPGEAIALRSLQLPQPRQTWTVLSCHMPSMWGAVHGINEHGVAAGTGSLRTRVSGCPTGLLGSDLVRLVLERARSARQAVDTLTDLSNRYGICQELGTSDKENGSAILLADEREAFAVELTGPYWAYQEVQETRFLGQTCTIRQDWNRVSPNLAADAIAQKRWPDDGSKVDFAGVVGEDLTTDEFGLRQWGQGTLLLAEQHGSIDTPFLRRTLQELQEADEQSVTRGSSVHLVARLGSRSEEALHVVWCGISSANLGLYLPVLLPGDLPAPMTCSAEQREAAPGYLLHQLGRQLSPGDEDWNTARESLARLQTRLDQDCEEFRAEARTLKQQGDAVELQRQASLFHQHSLERCQEVLQDLLGHVTQESRVLATY